MKLHADNNGLPGEAIGQSELLSENNANIFIEINEANATENLHAMLHYDNGNGTFEASEDSAVQISGEEVVKSINTS